MRPKHIRVQQIAIALLITHLQDGEYTIRELWELTGMWDSTIRDWLRAFKAKNLVHVSEWRSTMLNNPCIAVWTWGPGPDAVRPRKLSNSERQKRRRARIAVAAGRGFSVMAETLAT